MNMNHPIIDYLQNEAMVSLMNATKWRELALALEKFNGTGPKVCTKYLMDEKSGSGFCHMDWDWVKNGDTITIEWLKIDPIHKTFRGLLVSDLEEDCSDFFFKTLKEVGVQFSMDGQYFKVWGHVKSDSLPTFV
jgi:hypothetical protein